MIMTLSFVNGINIVFIYVGHLFTKNLSFSFFFFLGCMQEVALLTDGRFSGGSHGYVVGHICPEAQVSWPIYILTHYSCHVSHIW